MREKRSRDEIGSSAVRGGNIVGEHEVIFAGVDEVIEFKHSAYSRNVFAKGAVEAAKFLAGKEPGAFFVLSSKDQSSRQQMSVAVPVRGSGPSACTR